MKIRLRKAGFEDLIEIQQLSVECIAAICKRDYSPSQIDVWISSVENTKRWQQALTDQYFLVAETEQRIVGFGSLKNGDYLDFMYVHKDYVGRGIAKQLFSELEKESHRLSVIALTSDVSITARPFFEKMGFTVVRENKNIIKGTEIINYKMLKIKES